MRLLNLGFETADRWTRVLTLSIKYCRLRVDVSVVKRRRMQMTRSSALLGFWLAVALSGAAAVAQVPTQPPPSPASPAIIVPPQAAAGKPAEAEPQTPEAKPPNGKGAKNKVDPTAVPSKDPTAVGPAYVIGPEDALYIRVWKNPELSGTVTVGPDGTISLQLIDEVKASGLTPRQLEESLATRLKDFLTTPEVNVQVLAVRSRTYIILGDGVNRPGIYPLTRPMTVMEALIAGGNFSPFANKKKIYVLRGTQKFPFNWNEVSKGKNLTQNIKIQNGDQIYVP
jgi:polysaccharide biosynthesis/export protein